MVRINLVLSIFKNHFLWRLFLLTASIFLIPVFLGSITHETGSSTIYPLIIPVVGSIAIILFFSKINQTKVIAILTFIFFFIGVGTQQGSFINYTSLGLAICLLFFNAIRPWS